ncbi:MAG: acyl-CoA dehydrogenase family protein [Coriobacteriales bacterium]|jgi:alkylation response protein AidB-like acyl-CoA dehydrogenase
MQLTDQQKLIQKLAKTFAERELTKEVLDETEATAVFPKEIQDKMAKVGFYGIKTPREWGGAGADTVSYGLVMQEIAYRSAVASIYVSSPNSLSGGPLLKNGTPEQKEKYLRPIVNGEKILAFALTEPGAGSDAAGMSTVAVEDGDYYILNGRKTFITMAPFADYSLIFAKTTPEAGTHGITCFIVDMKSEGVSCGKAEDKMGVIGCATSDIILKDVRVPKEEVLGRVDHGFGIAMATLDVGRVGVAAQAVGVMRRALDEAVAYAKERKEFGRPISKFQGISFTIAEMAAKTHAAEVMLFDTCQIMDTGVRCSDKAAMTKLLCTEWCNWVVDRAVQIFGGYGYMKDYIVERLYRDARVFSIYEGTSEVQKIVIANSLLR